MILREINYANRNRKVQSKPLEVEERYEHGKK